MGWQRNGESKLSLTYANTDKQEGGMKHFVLKPERSAVGSLSTVLTTDRPDFWLFSLCLTGIVLLLHCAGWATLCATPPNSLCVAPSLWLPWPVCRRPCRLPSYAPGTPSCLGDLVAETHAFRVYCVLLSCPCPYATLYPSVGLCHTFHTRPLEPCLL